MTWTRTIARISVGGYRGTGTLVSKEALVLTAFHVIADREKSLRDRSAAFHAAPIRVVFGDPKNGDTWSTGDGSATCLRYSIEHDWALLQLAPGPLRASPLPLAKAGREMAPFETFGFPHAEQDLGGQYTGRLGALGGHIVELLLDNLPVGAEMGGISGAPCIVNGEVVGIILQSLADEDGRATKASLYMLAIEKAVAHFASLVDWKDDTELVFQRKVTNCLPADPTHLDDAGARLGLDQKRRSREQVARRMLVKDVEAVADALVAIPLHPQRQAEPILECVGAMMLHHDAIESLRAASNASRTPLLTAQTKRIHRWYLERAFDGEVAGRSIVVVRARSGEEELPETGASGQGASERHVLEIVARVRQVLEKRRLGKVIIDGMLSNANATAEVAKRRKFWLILAGERRPDVVDAVRKRLINAQVVMGLSDLPEFPDEYRDRITPIAPLLEGELELLEAWESSAARLKVPVEPEEDDT
jgi:hypothetical protein